MMTSANAVTSAANQAGNSPVSLSVSSSSQRLHRMADAGPAASSSSSKTEKSALVQSINKVWMGNLDTKLTEYQVLKIAEKFGNVVDFDFLYQFNEKGERSPRGYAFVTYESSESAARAIQLLDRKRIYTKDISVRYANSRQATADSSLVAKLSPARTAAKPTMNKPPLANATTQVLVAGSSVSGGSVPAALGGKEFLNIDDSRAGDKPNRQATDSNSEREKKIRALEAKLKMLERESGRDEFRPSPVPGTSGQTAKAGQIRHGSGSTNSSNSNRKHGHRQKPY